MQNVQTSVAREIGTMVLCVHCTLLQIHFWCKCRTQILALALQWLRKWSAQAVATGMVSEQSPISALWQITLPPSQDLKTTWGKLLNMCKMHSKPNWIYVFWSFCPNKRLNLQVTLPIFCITQQDQCHLESTPWQAVSDTHHHHNLTTQTFCLACLPFPGL